MAKKPKPKSNKTFEEAFNAALAKGEKTFPWNKKRYSTELREDGAHTGSWDPTKDWPKDGDWEGRRTPSDAGPDGYKRGGTVFRGGGAVQRPKRTKLY